MPDARKEQDISDSSKPNQDPIQYQVTVQETQPLQITTHDQTSQIQTSNPISQQMSVQTIPTMSHTTHVPISTPNSQQGQQKETQDHQIMHSNQVLCPMPPAAPVLTQTPAIMAPLHQTEWQDDIFDNPVQTPQERTSQILARINRVREKTQRMLNGNQPDPHNLHRVYEPLVGPDMLGNLPAQFPSVSTIAPVLPATYPPPAQGILGPPPPVMPTNINPGEHRHQPPPPSPIRSQIGSWDPKDLFVSTPPSCRSCAPLQRRGAA